MGDQEDIMSPDAFTTNNKTFEKFNCDSFVKLT